MNYAAYVPNKFTSLKPIPQRTMTLEERDKLSYSSTIRNFTYWRVQKTGEM